MESLSEKKEKRISVDFTNPYPPFPREIFFDVTNACNHKCHFCCSSKTKKTYFIDKNLAIRLMKEAYKNGTEDIALYATGEPFMYKNLAELVSESKDIGFKYVFISTNGSLALPERVKPVLDAGIDSIKFSVNAATRGSYKIVHGNDDFDTVIANIKWISKYRATSALRYKLYVSMVPTHITKNEWPLLSDMLSSYVDEMDLRGCSNQGGNMHENNKTEVIDKNNLLGSFKKHQFCGRCPDIFHRITITPEGYASACVVDYNNNLIIADLNNTSLKEAWHNNQYVELRKRHISNRIKGLICNNCLNNCNENIYPLMPQFVRK